MGVFKKRGGGILHGKTGTITGLAFETKEWDGKKGKDNYHTISATLTVQEDGQEEPTTAFVQAGFIHPDQDEAIDEDNPAVLTSESGEGFIGDDTDFAKLVNSAIEANPDLEEAINDGNGLDFSCLVGLRAKFERKVDEEANANFGKRKVKVKKGPNKGKTMEFNRDYLVITEVLGREDAKGGKKKAAAKKASKPAEEEAEEAGDDGDDDIATKTTAMLKKLLKKTAKIQKANLNSLVMKYAIEEDLDAEERDAMRKLVSSDKFLKTEDGWSYDGKVVTKG